MIDIKAIKAAAEAATQGEWVMECGDDEEEQPPLTMQDITISEISSWYYTKDQINFLIDKARETK